MRARGAFSYLKMIENDDSSLENDDSSFENDDSSFENLAFCDRWNYGAGETLVFTPRGGDPETLLVRAFDEGKTANAIIGTHENTIRAIRGKPKDTDWSVCEWYDLIDIKVR